MKKLKSFKLSEKTCGALIRLSDALGISQTAVVEIAVRTFEMAQKRKEVKPCKK